MSNETSDVHDGLQFFGTAADSYDRLHFTPPDQKMREICAARFPQATCLDGTAERVPLADDSVGAVLVGSAWHWFDAPAALTEIARVLPSDGRLGVLASSADTGVSWARDLYTEGDLGQQQRGAERHRGVELPSADFGPVSETTFHWSRPMAVSDIVPWFGTHSYDLNADDDTRKGVEDRAWRVIREVFPGEVSIDLPAMTMCWRADRSPR